MKKNKQAQSLTVSASYSITPNMQRIEFIVDDIANFPAHCAGQYIKLMFTPLGATDLSLLSREEKPVLRTYTIQAFNPATLQLTVDFVKHQPIAKDTSLSSASGGHGHYFAQHAKAGDMISVMGPNATKPIDLAADWFLFAADMTSLPALSNILNALPEHAKGHVVLELLSEEDLPSLSFPKGMNLQLAIKDKTSFLAAQIKQLPWLEGTPFVWCACEFSTMKTVRRYVADHHDVAHTDCYFSSYWKQGITEDGHKILKREDSEAFNK